MTQHRTLEQRTWPNAGIHPTAIVDESAELAEDVIVDAYAIIGPGVVIGPGTRVGPHALIERDTTVGAGCMIHNGAVLGTDPQDLKFGGEQTRLYVGDGTVIREYATLNRGTHARGRTDVGRECLIMAYAHVAHDCELGDHVILSNAVNMGGHVAIQDWAIVGGLTAIHQFVRIGEHAFVGGASRVHKDVPPFVRAAGSPLELHGLNSIGLQRRGIPEDVRSELKRIYRLFFRSSLNISQALEQVEAEGDAPDEVRRFIAFIRGTERGIAF